MSHNKTLSFPDKEWISINNYFAKHPRENMTRTLRFWIIQGLTRDDPSALDETKALIKRDEVDIAAAADFLGGIIREKGKLRKETIEGIISAGMNIEPKEAHKFSTMILKAPHLYGLGWSMGHICLKGD